MFQEARGGTCPLPSSSYPKLQPFWASVWACRHPLATSSAEVGTNSGQWHFHLFPAQEESATWAADGPLSSSNKRLCGGFEGEGSCWHLSHFQLWNPFFNSSEPLQKVRASCAFLLPKSCLLSFLENRRCYSDCTKKKKGCKLLFLS